ncbi:5-methyltetrahydropteroyltriglutamate--homocysteine S-methyltransferase [Solicola gregarius]|uniref:5-methyltetrahydropteroyltriglutamate--homocysteine methyltransferase n=1 Tax=Solicola gregarius TaxID=2908642 RepID=A0AA46YMJ5_9ACTN|nr:5-methyltetrahydropteroyltriglutamate--homocysteine S-methyltransferase [Solicola gregarius]UYM06689.1 5-methyltetrahydropteroyltriglutamate--homocysteine S-methyltransferase [Solicola gregarius]
MTTESPIGATVLGYPRIGRDRELKRALEAYWAGDEDATHLHAVAEATRIDALDTMTAGGLDSVPVNTFSWYDHILDTSVLVGATPERFAAVEPSGDLLAGFDAATYFAMARGVADVPPLEMTKWFDTNYHYLVPEISPDTVFALRADKPLQEYAEASARGVNARPVVVGPLTFLRLAKAADGAPAGFDPLDRLDDLVGVYAELLSVFAEAGVEWVQLDEPAAVLDLDPEELSRLQRAYERLGAIEGRPKLLVSTYFADPAGALPALAATPIDAIGIDIVRGTTVAGVAGVPGIADKTLVLGAVDGRNVWRTDLRRRLGELVPFLGAAGAIAVGTSCSLLHVPYDVERETGLPEGLRESLAFADQKIAEVVALQRALTHGADAVRATLDTSDRAAAGRASIPGVRDEAVRQRLALVDTEQRQRPARAERATAQAERFDLPALPTTTIGSFPQTAGVRAARAQLRAGTIGDDEYVKRMHAEIRRVIDLQERVGLDVLVHGEPERNDMVQYFAERLAGYAATTFGWVQSYGSRCVRPPILYGDVVRRDPITVGWTQYASACTTKPVKGMLTGPVTMLAWSFVRDDQPRSVTADQVALALRDEVADLEHAGVGIVQVDEPALRELLPLHVRDRKAYLSWAVDAFRLATSGVATSTQIHTHLCYSEFGDIVEAIDGLDADVTSIEAARSRMEVLGDLTARGFGGKVGPGVYDIHSPRVPEVAEVSALLTAALDSVPVDGLWVNPDCGLKTRTYPEVEAALTNLVAAARRARDAL